MTKRGDRAQMRRAWPRPLKAGAVPLAAALLLTGCGMNPGVTQQSKDIYELYNVLFIAATVIFVLVEGAILWAVVRYRRRDDLLPPQFHGNNLLEVAWTIIPFLIVASLFVWSWQILNRVDAQVADPHTTVVVTGFQWQWNFTFQGEKVRLEPGQPPEDLTIEGTIAKPPLIQLPVGRKIHFVLQSKDVIHAFYVREFLFKRDVVPGQVNSFDVTIDRAGTYTGQCYEYCGLAHNAMHFTVKAVPENEYRAWLADAKRRAESGCAADDTPGRIAAEKVAFDKNCLRAPANRAWSLTFNNQESVPHNIAIFRGRDANAPRHFNGPVFTGPASQTYQIQPLPAGKYYYHCDVHIQAMKGTLSVR